MKTKLMFMRVQVVFEQLGSPAMAVGVAPVLALLASGRTTGLGHGPRSRPLSRRTVEYYETLVVAARVVKLHAI